MCFNKHGFLDKVEYVWPRTCVVVCERSFGDEVGLSLVILTVAIFMLVSSIVVS